MNEQALQDAYNLFVQTGYNGDINKFMNLMSTNPEALQDAHNLFVQTGYNGDINKFKTLIGVGQQQPTVQPTQQQPTVKKKDDMESSWWFGDGSSESEPSKTEPETDIFSRAQKVLGIKQPVKEEQQVERPETTEEASATWKRAVKKEPESLPEYMQGYIPKKGEGVIAPTKLDFVGRMTPELVKEQTPKFLEEGLSALTPKQLASYGATGTKETFDYYFKDAGFKFETDREYVRAISPDGEVYTYNTLYPSSKALDEFKNFVRESAFNNPQIADKAYLYEKENKKFKTKEEIDNEVKSISTQEEQFMGDYKKMLNLYKDIENIEADLKRWRDAGEQNTPKYIQTEAYLNGIINEYNKYNVDLESKQVDLKAQKTQLDKAVGKYTDFQATQGDFGGNLYRSIANTSAGIFSNYLRLATSKTIDMLPISALMSEESYQSEIDRKLKEKGYGDEKVVPIDVLNDIKSEIRDDFKKAAITGKYQGEQLNNVLTVNGVRESLSEFMNKPITSTQEYLQERQEKGGFVERGLIGLAGSLPAMVGDKYLRYMNMFMMTTDAALQEMDNNPNFANISENEKELVALPIGVVGAALEEIGLKNLKLGKSITSGIVKAVIGRVPANATASTVRKATFDVVAEMGIKAGTAYAGGILSEMETGAAQQISEYAIKDIYNSMKEKKMFDNPAFLSGQYLYDVWDASRTEGVGAGVMSVPYSIAAAYQKDGFQALDDVTFKIFEDLAKDNESRKFFVTSLKNKINLGEVTPNQGKQMLEAYDQASGMIGSVPDEITDPQSRKIAMDLMSERKRLEQQKYGKDDALAKPIQDKINNINQQLSKLTEDAIQKQTASQVSVQPEAGAGQEVEVGGPEAKPKITPEESKRKEDLIAAFEDPKETEVLEDGKPFVYIKVGEYYTNKEMAQAELDAIIAKEQAAVTEQGGMEQAPAKLTPEESERKQALEEELEWAALQEGGGLRLDLDGIYVQGKIISLEDARAELDALNQKEQAAPAEGLGAQLEIVAKEEQTPAGVTPAPQTTTDIITSAPIEIKGGVVITDSDGNDVMVNGNEQVAAKLYDEAMAVLEEQRTPNQNDIVEKVQRIISQAAAETTTATEVTPAEQFTEQDRARKAELEEAMRKADKRRKNITVGEKTMPKAEAKAELDALVQKEQAAQQPAAAEVAPAEVTAEVVERTPEQEADLLEELLTGKKKVTPKEPKFQKGEQTKPTEEIESVIDEMNSMPEDVANFDVPSDLSTKKKTNITSLIKRFGDKLKSAFKGGIIKNISDYNGIPMIFTISDQLSSGKIKNEFTGNTIDINGGIGFNLTDGNENNAWANTTEEESVKMLNRAKEVYSKNKDLFDRLWAEGKLPKGQIPMAIVKMGQESIQTNEALFRFAADTIRKKFSKTERKNSLNGLIEDISAIDPKSKVISFIKDNNFRTIDELLDNMNKLKPIGERGTVTRFLFTGGLELNKETKPGKPRSKSGLALVGDKDASYYKYIHLQTINNAIQEDSTKEIPSSHIIGITGVDVLNPEITNPKHKNYPYGVKGGLIGILESPVHAADIFPEMYSKTFYLQKQNISGKSTSPKVAAEQAVAPSGFVATIKAFRGAKISTKMTELQKLLGKLKLAFPSVTIVETQQEFDKALENPEVKKFVKDGEVVYGFTKDGKIFLNPKKANSNTAIHEFSHIWMNFLKENNPKLLEKGYSLLEGTEVLKSKIAEFGNTELAREEAMAELIANKGETLIEAGKKSKFKNWLNAVYSYVKSKFKSFEKLTPNQFQNISLNDFIDGSLASLLSGREITSKEIKSIEVLFSKEKAKNNTEIIKIARANGISEAGIRAYFKKNGLSDIEIDTLFDEEKGAGKKIILTEETIPGYTKLMNRINGIIERGRRNGKTDDDIMKGVIANVESRSPEYANATNQQQEQIIRDIRKLFGKKEKAAPSAEKITGKPKPKKVTVNEMTALKDQIRLEARAAREAKGDLNAKRKMLAAAINDLAKKGKISVRQAKAIVNRISSVNLDNPVMVERLLTYAENIFNDADYDTRIQEVRKLQEKVKKVNHVSMRDTVREFASINPERIPAERLLDYIQALDDMSTRTPFYQKMNDMFDEVMSYKSESKEFDAIKTFQALIDKLESIAINQVKSVEDYVALIRDINSFKRKAYQLLQNGDITQEQYDQAIENVGKDQAAVEKKYEKELAALKEKLVQEINGLKPEVHPDFTPEEAALINKYLELSDDDLKSLSPEDLYILNDLLNNIKEDVQLDYYRLSEIVSKAYTNAGGQKLAEQLNESKFNKSTDEGKKLLLEQESAFWEGLLGLGRAASGALQKFIVSPFNRAIASYENTMKDGYYEFSKLKKKYKMKDYNMHRLGMFATYLQEYMAQFDSENKDVENIGTRDWFGEIISNSSMRNGYKSAKPSLMRLIGFGDTELKTIEKIYNSLPKDANGKVDPKAVYDSFMANDGKFFTKKEKAFFDKIMDWKQKNLTTKQKAANEMNGMPFKEIPFHMMRVRLDRGAKQISPKAEGGSGVVRIEAGTGKERASQRVGPIMTNFEQLFSENLEQTARNYYLKEAINDINNTLSVAKKNLKENKEGLFDTIPETISEALNFEFDKTESQYLASNLLAARAAETLLNPIRTAVELTSTFLSYPFRAKTPQGYKELFGKQGQMKKLLDFTSSPLRLRENINKAIDISDGRIKPKGKFEKAINYLSGLPERTMMVTSWMPTFNNEFKDITGVRFDMDKFNSDAAYRQKYGKAIKEAAAVADAQTEKIIGSTTKAGGRKDLRILPKIIANVFGVEGTVKKNTTAGQILGFFSNYPYREVTEFLNGFREAAEVYKQGGGALKSISQLQKPLGVTINLATYGFLSSVVYAMKLMLLGDDEDEEKGEATLKELMTLKGFMEELEGNAISLAASKYAAGGKAILQLTATVAYNSTSDEERKAKIKKLLKNSVFVEPIDAAKVQGYGGRNEVLGAIASYVPQFVLAAKRFEEGVQTAGELKVIYDKFQEGGLSALSEDEGLAILAIDGLLKSTQAIFNFRYGTSLPMYNDIKMYIKGVKKEAGVGDIKLSGTENKHKKALQGYKNEKEFKENDPEGYLEAIDEGGSIYKYKEEQRKKQEEKNKDKPFRGMSEEAFKKKYPEEWLENYGPGTDYYEEQRTDEAIERRAIQRKLKKEEKRIKAKNKENEEDTEE